jgi:hypothetical protein
MRPLQLVMPIAIVRARMLVIPIYTNLDNQLFNGSVINTDVPNADVGRDNNDHNINAVDVTFPSPPAILCRCFFCSGSERVLQFHMAGVHLYRGRFVLASRNARMLFLLLWMLLHLFPPLFQRMTLRLRGNWYHLH